jgi:hypothetical protein
LAGSAPNQGRSLFALLGRGLGRFDALGHDPVTSAAAIARKQLPDLLQRLLIAASSVPIQLVFVAHVYHLLRADLTDTLRLDEAQVERSAADVQ